MAETRRRVDLVVDMLLKGQTTQFIYDQFQTKFALSTRMVDTYIKKGRDEIKFATANDVEFRTSQALVRLDDLYYRNYSIADFRECRGVQETTNRLLGLNAPIRTDMTTKGQSLNKGFYDFLKETNPVKADERNGSDEDETEAE